MILALLVEWVRRNDGMPAMTIAERDARLGSATFDWRWHSADSASDVVTDDAYIELYAPSMSGLRWRT